MVIVAEQQTVAMKPLLPASLRSELNLMVMVVAVTGEGMEEPENVWVEAPSLTSTVSVSDCVLNAANVSVIGSRVVDSSLHS